MIQSPMTVSQISPEPRTRAAATMPDSTTYRRLQRALWPALAAVGLFSALINLLMLTGPLYMLQVYDRVLSSGSLATLGGLFLIVVVLYGFMGIYEFLRSRLLARVAIRLERDLAPAVFRIWLAAGRDRSRLGSDVQPMREVETLRSFLSGPAMGGLFDLPWIPLYLGLLFLIHPLLGWLTMAGAAVVAVAAWVTRVMTRVPLDRSVAMAGEARIFADRALHAAEMVDAMGMRGRVTGQWWNMQAVGLAHGQQASDVSEATGAFSKAFRLLLQSAMLTLGAWLVLRHEMSAGMIIATSILSGRALAPIDQVIAQWRVISRAAIAHRQLAQFFARLPAVPATVNLPPPTGRITVTGLTRLGAARAEREQTRLLNQISFELEPGDGLGIIGNSAAGKSTMARLLVGAWLPDMGEIRFDGATRDHWDPEIFGRHIGYLPQSVELLPGTIRDNIARFDPEATDKAIIEAAKAAGVHEMILALPQGYRMIVGRPDQPLSGGQIQRLGLARALFGQPQIVVLDEPNSNLDAEGEAALALAIRGLRARGATVVLMTHRTSALAEMNKIMLLNQGNAIRFGNREDVMRSLLPRPVQSQEKAAEPAEPVARLAPGA